MAEGMAEGVAEGVAVIMASRGASGKPAPTERASQTGRGSRRGGVAADMKNAVTGVTAWG
jgi:hypothetical protein